MEIVEWQRKIAKPIIFTEIGYKSQPKGCVDPWHEFAQGAPDMESQKKCYEAFIKAWHNEEVLVGVYFWNWSDGVGGVDDTTYTPRGKPAADIIRMWYEGDT